MDFSPSQQKKLERLARVLDNGDIALLEELGTLEERIDALTELIPPIEDVIARVKNGEPGDRGNDGDDGVDGIDGADYVLTESDKKEIAKSVQIPVVERVIERTETVIREIPIVTNEIVEREVAILDETTVAYLENKIEEVAKSKSKYTKDGIGLVIRELQAGTGITIDNSNQEYPIVSADGGTGLTNPMTTLGDVIYGATSGTPTRLAGNTTTLTKVLTQTGDGSISTAPSWEIIPTSGTLTYMFANTVSDIATYYKSVSFSTYSASTLGDITTAGVSTTPTVLGNFATDIGFPNVTVIPTGGYEVHYDTEKVAGANNYYTYAEIYKRASGGTETLIATTDISSQTAVNTRISVTVTGFNSATIPLLSTDRIVVRVYGVMLSSTATIHLYFDDATSARVSFPTATVDATNFVPYTGATLNVNLGTKTITASNFSGSSSGTQTNTNSGDNAVNTLYSGLVTNATHTGDATGATALTVVKINGTLMSGLATGILKNTTGTGVPSIAINSDLPPMSATVGGAVPTPPNNTTTFLRGDGTFAAPSGGSGLSFAQVYSLTTLSL